ncbi:hypothetical protein [Tenacibaculum sp. SG-28]|uniref:hypothetical protein n=1 Tax=Tenacibaculum sp. SG-28 TaxID=754426 RepID=UPI001E56FD8C|nr:hypothetical protein [Tenacibaculum sp. SG-28]
MTIKPYDDIINDYFSEIDEKLKGTQHKFIGIGNKTAAVDTSQFDSDIRVYPSVVELLEVV